MIVFVLLIQYTTTGVITPLMGFDTLQHCEAAKAKLKPAPGLMCIENVVAK